MATTERQTMMSMGSNSARAIFTAPDMQVSTSVARIMSMGPRFIAYDYRVP
jgi:hypothetical protein